MPGGFAVLAGRSPGRQYCNTCRIFQVYNSGSYRTFLPSSLKLSREDARASSDIEDFSMSRNFQVHELPAHLVSHGHKRTQGSGVFFSSNHDSQHHSHSLCIYTGVYISLVFEMQYTPLSELATWSTLPNSPGLRDLAASFRLVSWDWISYAEREAII